ncbi:two-component system, NarL family, response regulator [Chaetoceros tenuissimus]|uniref:Two-component system, NarL family, response regulator n=1 Tax=Chaetoceros tenuissimus TaxID=426638 RepID=A0AAD3H1N7_9STRA|nr:two-component system, NarL family, response regulator [Chaetoceros tenuissimus]
MRTHVGTSFSSHSKSTTRLFSSSRLYYQPGEDPPFYFNNPNDFDLSLQLTSHQSSTSTSPLPNYYQYSNEEPQEFLNGNSFQEYDLPSSYFSQEDFYPTASQQSSLNHEHSKPSLIWLIDDEISILDALSSYLSSSGYQIQSFQNATSALKSLKNQVPSAIVSDIRMPQMDGIEFLQNVRSDQNESVRNVPFILLTAKSQVEDRILGYESGTDGYLMKPFDPEELVAMLDQLMERRELYLDDVMSDDGQVGSGSGVSLDEIRNDLKEVKDILNGNEVDGKIGEKKQLVDANDSEPTPLALNSKSILSEDELEILELLCEGFMNKEIASELQYSVRWVEGHLTDMFRKTGCSNRTELVRWAVSNGYVDI